MRDVVTVDEQAEQAEESVAAEQAAVLLDDEQRRRVLDAMDRGGLNKKELGKATGYSQSSVSHFLSKPRAGRRATPWRVLEVVASAAGTTAEALLADPAARAAQEAAESAAAGSRNLNFEVLDYTRLPKRPLVEWGQCGLPSPAEGLTLQGWEGETEPIPEEGGILAAIGPRGFAVRIRGASMAGVGLRDGDIVFIAPDKGRGAYYGEPVLARLLDGDGGDLGMVVKVLHLDESGREYLQGKGLAGDDGPRYYRFEYYGACVGWHRYGTFSGGTSGSSGSSGSSGGPPPAREGPVFLTRPDNGNGNGGHDGLPSAAASESLRRAG